VRRGSWPGALAALCALAGAGCGGDAPEPDPVRPPDQLSREGGAALLDAEGRLDEALRTVRALRTPRKAERLHARVREIVSGGALEASELDDFGKAALGELGLAVPSLVGFDADGVAESLNRPAVADFLQHGRSDPALALLVPAREQVEAIERVIEDEQPGPRTRIPPQGPTASLDVSVADYLSELERKLRRAWPELAERLASAGADLDSRSMPGAS